MKLGSFRFGFMRIPDSKQFSYQPLYFNEEKEDLDRRVRESLLEKARLEGNLHKVLEESTERIEFKGAFGKSSRFREHDNFIRIKSSKRKQQSRVIIIAAILCMAYFVVRFLIF